MCPVLWVIKVNFRIYNFLIMTDQYFICSCNLPCLSCHETQKIKESEENKILFTQ